MSFLWLILAFQTFGAVKSDLISCDQPVIGRQLLGSRNMLEKLENKNVFPSKFLSLSPFWTH